MDKSIGQFMLEHRAELGMTQDEFGQRYGVSGPAIFKFEKGYIHPKLALWLRISQGMGIPERKAVLMHIRSKVPSEFQSFFNTDSKPKPRKGKAKGKALKDYRSITGAKELKATAKRDTGLPKTLRDLLAEDSLWESFKPTGREIETLRDSFGSLGRAGKDLYREALRLVREFNGGI